MLTTVAIMFVILLIALVVGVFLILFYNGLVRGKNRVEEAWSGISVQIKRRHDLIPALVRTVKGYATHENETLTRVTEARSQAMSAPPDSLASVIQAENGLSRALRSLFAVAENYPALMASENFLQLQAQLSQLEDEIQMARRYYNGTAREQNNRVLQFPGNLIAGTFGFSKIAYFELDDESEAEMPEVQF